jgi:Raf kinase inhibitor-like YbhB/YbcL family protein
MKNTYIVVGVVLAILIIGGVYAFNQGQAPTASNSTNTVTTNTTTNSSASTVLSLTSSAFQDGDSIPTRYTCDVTPPGTNPPLSFSGVPTGAISLALIVDDPDVPTQVLPAGVYDHWVLFNIPPSTSGMAASSTVGTAGANGSKINAYAAPCPPPQYAPAEHRYFFRLYALDAMLPLATGATKQQVLDAMKGHILAQTQLVGKYKRITQ